MEVDPLLNRAQRFLHLKKNRNNQNCEVSKWEENPHLKNLKFFLKNQNFPKILFEKKNHTTLVATWETKLRKFHHLRQEWDNYFLSVKSPWLHPVCGPACFHPPIPSFRGICKVRKFLLNLSMNHWNSAFNAQGLRIIVVIVKIRAAAKI